MYALSEKDKKGSRVQGENLIGKMALSYLPSMRAMYRTLRGKPVINEAGQLQPPFESHPTCHVYVSDKKTEAEIPEGMKQSEIGSSYRF